MDQTNLKELQRLLHEQRRAAEEKTYKRLADLAPSDLPNNEPGFEQYDDYNPRPAGDDDKFAMPYAQDPSAQDMREHVAGHDLETMLEVAISSGNEELIAQVLDEYTDKTAKEFLAANPADQPGGYLRRTPTWRK